MTVIRIVWKEAPGHAPDSTLQFIANETAAVILELSECGDSSLFGCGVGRTHFRLGAVRNLPWGFGASIFHGMSIRSGERVVREFIVENHSVPVNYHFATRTSGGERMLEATGSLASQVPSNLAIPSFVLGTFVFDAKSAFPRFWTPPNGDATKPALERLDTHRGAWRLAIGRTGVEAPVLPRFSPFAAREPLRPGGFPGDDFSLPAQETSYREILAYASRAGLSNPGSLVSSIELRNRSSSTLAGGLGKSRSVEAELAFAAVTTVHTIWKNTSSGPFGQANEPTFEHVSHQEESKAPAVGPAIVVRFDSTAREVLAYYFDSIDRSRIFITDSGMLLYSFRERIGSGADGSVIHSYIHIDAGLGLVVEGFVASGRAQAWYDAQWLGG